MKRTKSPLSSPYYVLVLLKHLVDHGKICTNKIPEILANGLPDDLQKNFSAGRNNSRYLETLFAFFYDQYGIEIITSDAREKRGCHRVVDREKLQRLLNLEDGTAFMRQLTFLKEMLPYLYEHIDPRIKKQYENSLKSRRSHYLFRTHPIESIEDQSLFHRIETALDGKRRLDIGYRQHDYKGAQPLRIIFMEGNFYLACLTDDDVNNGFKLLRFSEIDHLEVTEERFNETEKVLEAQSFIDEEIQSPFPQFRKATRRVVVRGDKKAAQHLKKKKYFPSQEERPLPDEGIEIELWLADYMEIAPFVRKWIPHMQLIEPADWADRMKHELQTYLQNLDNALPDIQTG